MIVPDVNLLLYATIDAFPHHPAARAWWEGTLSSSGPVGLAIPAVLGFLRIATNRRVLSTPMSLAAARGTVNEWLGQPFVTVVRPGREHLETVLDLLTSAGTAGNLTTDAQLAATALEHRGIVHTADTDFARFPQVSWTNPLLDRSAG